MLYRPETKAARKNMRVNDGDYLEHCGAARAA